MVTTSTTWTIASTLLIVWTWLTDLGWNLLKIGPIVNQKIIRGRSRQLMRHLDSPGQAITLQVKFNQVNRTNQVLWAPMKEDRKEIDVEEGKELPRLLPMPTNQKYKTKKESKKSKIEAAKKGRASWKKKLNSLNNWKVYRFTTLRSAYYLWE